MSATWKVWQKPEVANGFIDARRGGILGAEQQIDTMLRLIRYVPASQLTVLDLGCGDGVLLHAVMSAFPIERGIALDGSPAMLEKAEIRFEGLGLLSGLVEFIEADFDDPRWQEILPVERFDVIVSGFAIHHLEDDRKRALYGEVHELLRPGGIFVNIEHVASVTSQGEELFERAAAENLARFRQSIGIDANDAAVYVELLERPDKSANRLATVETQLGWLREIGFRDVDCYWKQFELAVLAGYR